MKRFEEQFKKQAQSVHLRAAERRNLKERLVSYMEYHPMPKGVPQKKAIGPIGRAGYSCQCRTADLDSHAPYPIFPFNGR